MIRPFYILLIFIFSCSLNLTASDPDSTFEKKVTINGYVKDGGTGELMPGVTVFETNLKTGTSTNNNGFYSISLPPGNYELQFSYIGFQTMKMGGNAQKNISLNVSLVPSETRLGEVVVEGKRADENVRAPAMSIVELDVKTITKVPSLLGEIDLVKVIQLLPGVQSTSEGSTGFSVRGGTADQNLILLDDATIYNASHLMGFFSIFNNDAVKNVTLYKGDIPAAYGGRLSSLLEVQMKEGNPKRFALTGSIGTVSSKLTLEGPIIRDRTTWLIAGRRTYADLFLPFAKDESVRDNKLYFYDFNLKLTHTINEKNRLYATGYGGRDVFKNQFSAVEFGNQAATLRWNHIFSKNIFLNTSLLYSRYNYNLGNPEDDIDSFKWLADLSEYTSRLDFTHYLPLNHKLRYGATISYHQISPGRVKGIGNTGSGTEFIVPSSYALESSLYITDDYRITDKLTIKYGLRFAAFQNIGPGTVYDYDDEYKPADSTVYRNGEIYNTYTGFEPRVAFIYLINQQSSVKASYSHTEQYLTLAQNSTAGTPLDIWFPASPNVKPQLCDQFAAGYFRNFSKNMFELSAEVYYKNLKDLIDFRDHAQLFLNQYLEGELRIGKGYSYGIETLIRKNEGRLSGWISYTYSRSFRIVPEINNGNQYVSPYDKPNNLNIVVNYEILPRLEASATWIYATGMPVTFPTGKAMIGNAFIPIYSDRNSYRMEDYHRLDLSVTFKSKEKPGKRWHSDLNLSVYNAYNRHNAWAINFVQDPADPYVTYAEKTYLFAIIPALTYTIRFQ
jgi:hypothetical protein